MKNIAIKVIFGIFGIFILGLFIRPQKIIYEAKIIGNKIDENEVSIKNELV